MVSDDIKKFRLALGATQESLARRMNLTVRTIARYEADQPPKGKALRRLIDLADQTGHDEFVRIFVRHLEEEFGLMAVNRNSELQMNVMRAQVSLLDLNADDLTVQRAREVGQEAGALLNKVAEALRELNPYANWKEE